MRIEFGTDEPTLSERGLGFARAVEVFAGHRCTAEDLRDDYSEPRHVTTGTLDDREVVMVWTPRGAARPIISMRKANEREQARYAHKLG